MKQAELARRVGISTSYMNLIEHNHRDVGGALLAKLAVALETDVSRLRNGAEAMLLEACGAAGEAHADCMPEMAELDDLAERFPGWARLIASQHDEAQRATDLLRLLNDRLSHDPYLSASIHDVLSSVTSIRSASAILADGSDLDPAWQSRFHRNIYEDSQRLAQTMGGLVSYLDQDRSADRTKALPQEEVEQWLQEHEWSFSDEDHAADCVAQNTWSTQVARHMAETYAATFIQDAVDIPVEVLKPLIETLGPDPLELAWKTGMSVPQIIRRLAVLPSETFPDGSARGAVACDASGTIIFRKPVRGFDVPRFGAACPLWPLFQALQRPQTPLVNTVRLPGEGVEGAMFDVHAFAEMEFPDGYAGPPLTKAWMLISPATDDQAQAYPVGLSCRVCSHSDCKARREPAFFASE